MEFLAARNHQVFWPPQSQTHIPCNWRLLFQLLREMVAPREERLGSRYADGGEAVERDHVLFCGQVYWQCSASVSQVGFQGTLTWVLRFIKSCRVVHTIVIRLFPRWLSGKESACNAGDMGSIPGLGGSPGEENGNSPQYPCLVNPSDRGRWGSKRVRHDSVTKQWHTK